MDMSYEETNSNDTRFNVKHYRVRFEKRRENPIRFVVNVLSYAIFIFLLKKALFFKVLFFICYLLFILLLIYKYFYNLNFVSYSFFQV